MGNGSLGFVLHNKRYKGLCILHANLASATELHIFTSNRELMVKLPRHCWLFYNRADLRCPELCSPRCPGLQPQLQLSATALSSVHLSGGTTVLPVLADAMQG